MFLIWLNDPLDSTKEKPRKAHSRGGEDNCGIKTHDVEYQRNKIFKGINYTTQMTYLWMK